MKRNEFLRRCETIYDKGLIRPETVSLLEKWLDLVMRLEGGQLTNVVEILYDEKKRTENFAGHRTLASDPDGYALIQLAAILSHPCQECAEDKEAWHTRTAFCKHKKER